MIIDLFSESIYATKIDIDTSNIKQDALNLLQENKLKPRWYSKMLTTHEALNTTETYSYLLDKIGKEVHLYLTQMGYEVKRLALVDSWVNVGLKHSYQEVHTHIPAHISGVFFISIPENSGNLIIRKAISDYRLPNVKTISRHNDTQYIIDCKENDLILFKSNTQHYVTQNLSDKPRISLSFNFVIDE